MTSPTPPLRKPLPTVLADDFDPPSPWRTFYVHLQGASPDKWNYGKRTQRTIDHLADEELAWVIRVAQAECAKRLKRAAQKVAS